MNVYDSERMADILTPHGYSLSDRADDADLVILNTCHIREKAAEKVYSELGRMRRAQQTRRDQGADMTIAGMISSPSACATQPATAIVISAP